MAVPGGIGLDNIAAVELRSRVEEAFDVVLPDEVLAAVLEPSGEAQSRWSLYHDGGPASG